MNPEAKLPTMLRVIIVDDHPLVIHGLKALLGMLDDFIVVGEATTAEQALILCESVKPDVILMDIIKPSSLGMKRMAQVHERYPRIPIVALSGSNETSLVTAAIQAGATSYVLKNITIAQLSDAIRATLGGQSVMSPEVTHKLVNALTRPTRHDYDLTDRETEILTLLCKGRTNLEIASTLHITVATVKFHMTNILAKLGATHRSQAIAIALEQKIV